MSVWWERIDRKEELLAVRRLVPQGGCLVVRGDDSSGKQQFILLASEFLQTLGYECWMAALNTEAAGVRQQLIALWELMHSPSPGYEISVRTWAANLGDRELLERVRTLIQNRDPPPAVIFEEIDRDSPQDPQRLALLTDLAAGGACPVIVTAGLGAEWPRLAGEQVLTLSGFTTEDIRDCLLSTPELKSISVKTLEEAIDQVRPPGGGRGGIEPMLAFQILEAKGREWHLA